MPTGVASPESTPEAPNWQDPSLRGLAAMTLQAMPSLEVLFLDDLAAYLMGSGPLEEPYTIEHGSHVLSLLLGAVVNSPHYQPAETPAVTDEMLVARESFVRGAHDFAGRGAKGLIQLVNRLVPAIVGELEIQKEAPEAQTSQLFHYGMLAVASGPANSLSDEAAAGFRQILSGWDGLFGQGFTLPWREATAAP